MNNSKNKTFRATFDYDKAIQNVQHDTTIPAFKRNQIAKRLQILKKEKAGQEISIGKDDKGLFWKWNDPRNQEGRTGGVADSLKSKIGFGGKGFLGLQGDKFDEAYDYMVARGYYNNLDKHASSKTPSKVYPDLSKFNLNFSSKLTPAQFGKIYQSTHLDANATNTANQNTAVPIIKTNLTENLPKEVATVKPNGTTENDNSKVTVNSADKKNQEYPYDPYTRHNDEVVITKPVSIFDSNFKPIDRNDPKYKTPYTGPEVERFGKNPNELLEYLKKHKDDSWSMGMDHIAKFLKGGWGRPKKIKIGFFKTRSGHLGFFTDETSLPEAYFFDDPSKKVNRDDLPDVYGNFNFELIRDDNGKFKIAPIVSPVYKTIEPNNNIVSTEPVRETPKKDADAGINSAALGNDVNLSAQQKNISAAPVNTQNVSSQNPSNFHITTSPNVEKWGLLGVIAKNITENLNNNSVYNTPIAPNPSTLFSSHPKHKNGGKLRLVPKGQWGLSFANFAAKDAYNSIFDPLTMFSNEPGMKSSVNVGETTLSNLKPIDYLKPKTIGLRDSVSDTFTGDTTNHVRNNFNGGGGQKFNFKLPVAPIVDFLTSKPQSVEVPKAPLVQYSPIEERQERGLSNDFINKTKENFEQTLGNPLKSSSQNQVLSSVFARNKAAVNLTNGIMQNDLQLREKTHDQQTQDERQNQLTLQKINNQNNGIIYKNKVNEAQADLERKLINQKRWSNLIKGVVNANTANELTENQANILANQNKYKSDYNNLIQQHNAGKLSLAEFNTKSNNLYNDYTNNLNNFLQKRNNAGSVSGFLSGLFSKYSSGGKLSDKEALAAYKANLNLRRKILEYNRKRKLRDKEIALKREALIKKYNKDFFDMLRKMV